jgi:hypothetical protein
MNQVLTVVISFILGAVVDHFFEARSLAVLLRALRQMEERILEEIRKR